MLLEGSKRKGGKNGHQGSLRSASSRVFHVPKGSGEKAYGFSVVEPLGRSELSHLSPDLLATSSSAPATSQSTPHPPASSRPSEGWETPAVSPDQPFLPSLELESRARIATRSHNGTTASEFH